MKAIALALFMLSAVPALAQETDPFAWKPEHRRIADIATDVTVGLNIGAELFHAFKAEDRWHAVGCDALRNGLVIGSAELVKLLVHRTRPDGSDRKSFFSEHTALASVNTGWRFGVSVPLAIVTGYGRTAAAKHYATDVLTGAGVGFASRWVCR